MGDVQDRLKSLEARRQNLVSIEARAAANAERATEDLAQAQADLYKMGFENVDAAKQWLQQASEDISAAMSSLEDSLTKAGV